MKHAISQTKIQYAKVYVEIGQRHLTAPNRDPNELLEIILCLLTKSKAECQKNDTISMPASSHTNLQIALAFCYSKSLYDNTNQVQELMSLLGQKNEQMPKDQIIPVYDGFIDFLKQGKDNYEVEELYYLKRYLAPLL
ncbi:hypothetical protein [Calidifontibacillus erzurumensis]|uniref:hypothetical protein n=1 Tax=Calidifontibacillus erzurumensis TaxID=2741433 RepID=UPI0035B509A2